MFSTGFTFSCTQVVKLLVQGPDLQTPIVREHKGSCMKL